MVCDFREIKKKLAKVLETLDHGYLNKIPYFKKYYNPTSEKIAEFIYFELKKLIKGGEFALRSISVWETDSACAVFSEGKV
jgi:6-pyruvoyltetrahydropterin/6-carboxytetrahydropterin synthase